MEFDATNSPFIRLPHPHTNIFITPPRYTDGAVTIATYNDPSVYINLVKTPFPYAQQDWDSEFPILEKAAEDALAEWRQAGGGWVASCPVGKIREIDPETGEDRFFGSIVVRRRGFMMIGDEGERRVVKEENDGLQPGDPRIAWEIGCLLPGACCDERVR